MDRRADEARRDVTALAACLTAWRDREEGIDAEVGGFLLAESLIGLRDHIGFKR